MARTATLGIAGFLLSVLFVLASLWWIPDSASAAVMEPAPPGPVVDIPDVPSRALGTYGTAGPMGDQVLVDMWRILTGRGAPASGSVVPAVVPDVKPITGMQAMSRAGGTALTAALVGWGISSNGTLALVGVANGSDYGTAFCSQPAWYQGVTSFVNMGFAPDCKSVANTLPTGTVVTGGKLIYGSWSAAFLGTQAGSVSSAGAKAWCWDTTGTLAAGFAAYGLPSGGWVSSGGSMSYLGPTGPCWSGGSNYADLRIPGSAAGQPVLVVRQGGASGTIVAQAQPVSIVDAKDATRTPKCSISWEDGTTTVGTGTAYTDASNIPLSAALLGCEQAYVSKPGRGPALMPSRIKVDSEDEAGAITTIADQEVPDMAPDQRRAFETGNGRGLVLEKLTGAITESCMTWEADCAGWWAATSAGTTPEVGSSTYRCTFAGQPIALAECGPYRETFDTKTGTPTITNPVTGEPVPWSAGTPGWQTVTPTVTGGGACGAAWSWNPVDWVLNPLKCAFVPSSTAVQTATAAVQTAWDGTWPVQGMQAATAAIVALQSVNLSGCSGPHVNFALSWPVPMVFDAYPLNACGPPYDVLANICRIVGALLLMGYTAWGVTRRVGAVVGAPGVGPA